MEVTLIWFWQDFLFFILPGLIWLFMKNIHHLWRLRSSNYYKKNSGTVKNSSVLSTHVNKNF